MPKRPLAHHLTLILLAKLIALSLLYVACFAPWQRPPLTDTGVAEALFGSGRTVTR